VGNCGVVSFFNVLQKKKVQVVPGNLGKEVEGIGEKSVLEMPSTPRGQNKAQREGKGQTGGENDESPQAHLNYLNEEAWPKGSTKDEGVAADACLAGGNREGNE